MARPLTKTYDDRNPYVVERKDLPNGTIAYDIYDERPESYRFVGSITDEFGTNGYAKYDAEQIARALNALVQTGQEKLPKVKVGWDD